MIERHEDTFVDPRPVAGEARDDEPTRKVRLTWDGRGQVVVSPVPRAGRSVPRVSLVAPRQGTSDHDTVVDVDPQLLQPADDEAGEPDLEAIFQDLRRRFRRA